MAIHLNGPCSYAYINSFHETGIKSPLDAAVLQHNHLDIQAYRKLREIPFDFERRRLSVVVETGGKTMLITKGAPESVLDMSSFYEADGQSRPLDAEIRAQAEATYQRLSAQGFRLLAVAYRFVSVQDTYTIADEKDMVFIGFSHLF